VDSRIWSTALHNQEVKGTKRDASHCRAIMVLPTGSFHLYLQCHPDKIALTASGNRAIVSLDSFRMRKAIFVLSSS